MLCFAFTLEDWLVRPGGRDVQRKHIEHRKVPHFLICLASPVVSMVLRESASGRRHLSAGTRCIHSRMFFSRCGCPGPSLRFRGKRRLYPVGLD